MQSKNSHYPEHLTYPADKPLPKEVATRTSHGTKLNELSAGTKKQIKKTHNRRSRRYVKDKMWSHLLDY